MENRVLNCPHCDKELEVDASLLGQNLKCPLCNKEFGFEDGNPVILEQNKIISAQKSDEKTCPYCGETIKSIAVKCKHCQSDLSENVSSGKDKSTQQSQKKILPTFLLFWLFGVFGAHRLYVDRTMSGCFQFLTTAAAFIILIVSSPEPILLVIPIFLGVWMVYDFVMVITGSFKDGKGGIISKWT